MQGKVSGTAGSAVGAQRLMGALLGLRMVEAGGTVGCCEHTLLFGYTQLLVCRGNFTCDCQARDTGQYAHHCGGKNSSMFCYGNTFFFLT